MAITATRGSKITIVTFLVIFGGIMLSTSGYERFQGKKAQSWPAQQARVVSSELKHDTSRTGNSGAWYSDIDCIFLDSHKPFNLKRISYGQVMDSSRSGKEIQTQLVKEYPAGREFVVYVCPEDSSKIIAKKTYSFRRETIEQYAGGGLILLAIAFCFVKTNDKPKQVEQPE
jgi:hypothetical protein